MNTFVSAAAYPPGDLKLVVRINFDTLYSLGWEGTRGRFFARYQWALLSPADARYVDRCVRLSWLENDWDAGSELFDRSAGLATQSARPSHQGFQAPQGYPAYRRAHPLRRGHWTRKTDGPPDYDAVTRFRPVTRSRRFRNGASRPSL
jgi:hypothetical protein